MTKKEQLKRADEKIHAMLKTIGELRKEVKDKEEAVKQVQSMLDSILIRIINAYGKDGVAELKDESMEDVLKAYTLEAEKAEGLIVLRVKKNGNK